MISGKSCTFHLVFTECSERGRKEEGKKRRGRREERKEEEIGGEDGRNIEKWTFESFSSTAIDRSIGIGQIGVEKTMFDFFRESRGRASKNNLRIVQAPKTAMRRFQQAHI